MVAFDFVPDIIQKQGRNWLKWEVRKLIGSLAKTGQPIPVKMNSALRALGYDIIDEVHDAGLTFCADLKLVDIGNTLKTDGLFLQEARPEMLTVYCAEGIISLKAIRLAIPQTEILGVTVLTDIDNAESKILFRRGVPKEVLALANRGMEANFNGFVSSGLEAKSLRCNFGEVVSLNPPAVRPEHAIVQGDDQKRIVTPAKAFGAGADRIIVGRPITQAKSPYDAYMRTLDEINRFFEKQQ